VGYGVQRKRDLISSIVKLDGKELTEVPTPSFENGLQGKCSISFIISEKGVISSVKVTKGVPDCPECDKAFIKTIKSMPNWKPSRLNGRCVSSYCSTSITFLLE